MAVKPNSTYTLSAWVQGGYSYLGVTGTGTTDVSTWTPDTSSWKQLSTTFTTGASTTSVSVYTHGWYGQAAYYADDISVYGPDGGGGGDPAPTVPAAPTGVSVSSTTSSSVSLAWSTVSGATGYNVYRNGTKITAVTGTSATVTGLAASTSYSFQVTATNSAGESAKSATVTGTTTAGKRERRRLPAEARGDRLLAELQQRRDRPEALGRLLPVRHHRGGLRGRDHDSGRGLLHARLGGPRRLHGRPVQGGHRRQARGLSKKVVISIGGQNGTISVSDSASAANFANSVYSLMQTYGFDGVDIDLENGINATYMTQALRSLSAKAGSSLIITMAPQTIDMQSTSNAYFQTALNIKDILTVVNMQYYNSGTMLGCDGKVYGQGTVDFLTALACIQLQGGLAPSQVGLGLPASTSAA